MLVAISDLIISIEKNVEDKNDKEYLYIINRKWKLIKRHINVLWNTTTDDNKYQIIAGERRWQACCLTGMKTVPIRIKDADDDKALAYEIHSLSKVKRYPFSHGCSVSQQSD